ncbi:oxidoreductase, partial [Klebsiella pneumoniae]
LHCSMLVAGGSSRFTVHGDKGSVIKARADQQESQLLAGVVPGSAGWGQDDDPLVIYDASLQAHAQATPQGDQRQYYMLIRDALKGQIANPVPPVEALAVMAVLEAAVRSAESGMVQTLDLSDNERNMLR